MPNHIKTHCKSCTHQMLTSQLTQEQNPGENVKMLRKHNSANNTVEHFTVVENGEQNFQGQLVKRFVI